MILMHPAIFAYTVQPKERFKLEQIRRLYKLDLFAEHRSAIILQAVEHFSLLMRLHFFIFATKSFRFQIPFLFFFHRVVKMCLGLFQLQSSHSFGILLVLAASFYRGCLVLMLLNFGCVPSLWYINYQSDVITPKLIFAVVVAFLPFVLTPLINIHFIF